MKIEPIVTLTILYILSAAVPFFLIKHSKSPRERSFMIGGSIPWLIGIFSVGPLYLLFHSGYIVGAFTGPMVMIASYLVGRGRQIRKTERTDAA
jgi:hypothetical protein